MGKTLKLNGTYRRKPDLVEARRVTVENIEAVAQWSRGLHRGTLLPREEQTIKIDVNGDEQTVYVGDWVVRGLDGSYYKLTDAQFNAHYDPVPITIQAGPAVAR